MGRSFNKELPKVPIGPAQFQGFLVACAHSTWRRARYVLWVASSRRLRLPAPS